MTKAKRVIAITAAALLVLALLGSCFVSDHEDKKAAEIKSEHIDTVELVIVQQAVQLAEAAETDELQTEYEYIPSTQADSRRGLHKRARAYRDYRGIRQTVQYMPRAAAGNSNAREHAILASY